MDKVEYKILTEEIKKLINKGEFVKAVQIADRIDWNKVHSIMMLCTISDLYKANRRFEDAKDLLYLAYKRSPNSRTILYSLCDLSIKLEEFISAIEYYKAFVEVAPKDSGRYVLQYRLYQAQEANIEDRIEVLVALKKKEYIEKWAYELAYLYHRIGLATECVEECDELILWFGEGKYVNKAMELKMLHQPLSEKQEYKYQHRFDNLDDGHGMTRVLPRVEVDTGNENFIPVEDSPTVEIPSDIIEQSLAETEQISVKVLDVHNIYSTMNLEKELADSLKAVYDSNEEKIVEPTIGMSFAEPMSDIVGATTEEIQVEEAEGEIETEVFEDIVAESDEIEELVEEQADEVEELAEEQEDEVEAPIEEPEILFPEIEVEDFPIESEENIEDAMLDAFEEEYFDDTQKDTIRIPIEEIQEQIDNLPVDSPLQEEEIIDIDIEEETDEVESEFEDLFTPNTKNLLVVASDVKSRDAYISEYITSILGHKAASEEILFLTGFKLNRHYKQYFQEMNEKTVVVISSVDTLRDELMDVLWRYLDEREAPLQVIFADKKKTIQKVYAKHKKIKQYFTNVVELEEILISDLVEHAIKYAYDLEYSLDEMAVLAIETLLEAGQISDSTLDYKDAEDMIDAAISKVKKKNISHFIDVLLGRRYDDEDMIILKEQYFWN
ncbi:MAG: hypothetical protein R3Y47_00510 [Lachnospiraceae bacterium]